MKGTQEKFFKLMEALAADNGFEFVVDYNWANTGIAAFQRVGSFSPVLRFHFDFQTSSASFDWREGFDLTKATYAAADGSKRLGSYFATSELDRAVRYITGELLAFVPAENGRKKFDGKKFEREAEQLAERWRKAKVKR